MKINYKNEIYKIIEISYKHKVSHIPSALSQMMYFKYIIPRVKDFDWVAGKQFGWQAYVVYDERIKPEEIDVILLLNGINKDIEINEDNALQIISNYYCNSYFVLGGPIARMLFNYILISNKDRKSVV